VLQLAHRHAHYPAYLPIYLCLPKSTGRIESNAILDAFKRQVTACPPLVYSHAEFSFTLLKVDGSFGWHYCLWTRAGWVDADTDTEPPLTHSLQCELTWKSHSFRRSWATLKDVFAMESDVPMERQLCRREQFIQLLRMDPGTLEERWRLCCRNVNTMRKGLPIGARRSLHERKDWAAGLLVLCAGS
jgi:hypothetical protein